MKDFDLDVNFNGDESDIIYLNADGDEPITADPKTAEKLENQGNLKKIGGIEKIINIINRFENFSDLEDYIKLVNEKYLRRLLIELGSQIIVGGYTTSTNINDILDKTEQSIYNLTQQKFLEQVYTSAEIIDDVFNELKSKIKKDKPSSLLSQFKDLDSIIQGFEKSDLIIEFITRVEGLHKIYLYLNYLMYD
jgi:replicative DNA helicase